MPNPAGKIYSFVGLFPIEPATNCTALRQYLRSLDSDPRGSPLSAVNNIQTARLAIMDEAFFEGIPGRPDQFASRYLFFACNYDGSSVSHLTDRLAKNIPTDVRSIWGAVAAARI
jgi:hypothetical protein